MKPSLRNSAAALCALFIGFGLAPPQLAAQSEEADDLNVTEIKIKGINVHGDACGASSVGVDITPDEKVFSVLFDGYFVEHIPDGPKRLRRRCTIDVNLQIPETWTYGVFYSALNGYAYLEGGVHTKQTMQYRFLPSGKSEKIDDLIIRGVYDDNYEQLNQLPLNRVQFAPCRSGDKILSIETELILVGKNDGYGFVQVDRLDGATQSYGLVLKPCKADPKNHKKFFATCNADLVGKANGVAKGKVVTQGKGKTAADAVKKAYNRLKNKCRKKESNRPRWACNLQPEANACSSVALFPE